MIPIPSGTFQGGCNTSENLKKSFVFGGLPQGSDVEEESATGRSMAVEDDSLTTLLVGGATPLGSSHCGDVNSSVYRVCR